MKKFIIILVFSFLQEGALFASDNSEQTSDIKQKTPQKVYVGLEFGQGIVQAEPAYNYDDDGVDIDYADDISFSKDNYFKLQSGIYYKKLKGIWEFDLIWEPHMMHIGNAGYEVDPYLKIKRSLLFSGVSAKLSTQWLAISIGFGGVYIKQRLSKSSNSDLRTKVDIGSSDYVKPYSKISIEFNKTVYKKHELFIAFSNWGWSDEHGVATTLDKRDSPPTYLQVYGLPEFHRISTVGLGINYFFDEW